MKRAVLRSREMTVVVLPGPGERRILSKSVIECRR